MLILYFRETKRAGSRNPDRTEKRKQMSREIIMIQATQIVQHLIAAQRPKLLRGVALLQDAAERLRIESAKTLLAAVMMPQGRDPKRAYSEDERLTVWHRDGGICYHCEHEIPFADSHADHVIPWSLGGRTVVENAVCSCSHCNTQRGNKLAYTSDRKAN
jgi:hypothetical protein